MRRNGHLKETLQEAGMKLCKRLNNREIILEEDGQEQLWMANPGGVPGYAIVIDKVEYEFVRSVD